MVAIVHNGKSLRNILHYNENKLKQRQAVLIHAVNYPKDTDQLTLKDKITRLEKLTALNQQTKVNSVHISLNFDASEKLHQQTLQQIAEKYMNKIGFGEQPYLIYEHHDAGHQHLHIVTTNIKADGRRIELHNLARNQSMKAAKEIEREYRLVVATEKHRLAHTLKPVNVQKIIYGKSETKRAITVVLDAVLPHYKYTSLAELNAILRQYNVLADRCAEGSRVYQNRGLVYRVLDDKGEKIGIPVKASLIYSKPTLQNIEQRFAENQVQRQQHKQRVKNAIDLSFLKTSQPTLAKIAEQLKRENIVTVIRQNAQGVIYGMTYVDHKTKCVFNGSDLGKGYSANAMQQRCDPSAQLHLANEFTQTQSLASELWEILTETHGQKQTLDPWEFRKKKKRKQRIK